MGEKATPKKAVWPLAERAADIENAKPGPPGLAERLENLQAELKAKRGKQRS